MAVDADQDVGEVGERVDAVETAAGEDRAQNAGALGPGLAAGEEPVLATDGDAPELALGGVVVEAQAPVVEEPGERPPLVARLAAAALRETARRKRKLVERDTIARVIEEDTRERDR